LAKVTALRAVLRSSLLHGLIIDEVTAQALATDKPEATSGKTIRTTANPSVRTPTRSGPAVLQRICDPVSS
jgi:hypothetical protein